MALTKLNSASMPTDSVIQVKQGGRLTKFESTGDTTFTDCGVSVNITPSSTSSKILITVSGAISNNGSSGQRMRIRLFRNTTEIGSGTGGSTYNDFIMSLQEQVYHMECFSQSHLDEPATTSQINYKIQIASGSTPNVCIGGRADGTEVGVPTRITAMEIAG